MSYPTGSQCDKNGGIPILGNAGSSRVCGVRSLHSNALMGCCGGNKIQTAQCTQYCSTTTGLGEFAKCVVNNGKNSSMTGILPEDVFCEHGLMRKTTKTSFGSQCARPPRLGFLAILLFVGILISEVTAYTTPSLAHRHGRRDSCEFKQIQNYTMTRTESIQTTSDLSCARDSFCAQSATIQTGIANNNRTVNGVSAADSKYDELFIVLMKQTGRDFPAQSSIEMQLEYIAEAGDTFRIDFTPFAWCAQGTVSNCGDLPKAKNPDGKVEVCGPLFASDLESGTGSPAAIQGALSLVKLA